jgi:hypothetical protein
VVLFIIVFGLACWVIAASMDREKFTPSPPPPDDSPPEWLRRHMEKHFGGNES